jgi:outer membrane protein assembly factor BamB
VATLFLILLAALRIVHFNGGTATITTQSGGEHVVIKDAKGQLEAESSCDSQSGTYDQIVKFGQAVVAAAYHNDRTAMMSLVQFPLRVNASSTKSTLVINKATLQSRYSVTFTAPVLAKLRQVEPHDVFCRNGMSMLGSGVVWATVDHNGNLKAAVINQ